LTLPLRIGIAGGYCSGKNEAARILKERGFACLDMDEAGHAALASRSREIAARFGEGMLRPDGKPDREAIGNIVFRDMRALRDLEAIVHPEMEKRAREWLQANASRDVCVNAALLHRMGLMAMLDAAIEIRAPLLLRLARARRRDGRRLLGALRRIWSQRSFSALLRAAGKPVLVVRNRGGTAALAAGLDKALSQLSLK
jgi:dephospho-CoA kinase